jgi:hypothetical protein
MASYYKLFKKYYGVQKIYFSLSHQANLEPSLEYFIHFPEEKNKVSFLVFIYIPSLVRAVNNIVRF